MLLSNDDKSIARERSSCQECRVSLGRRHAAVEEAVYAGALGMPNDRGAASCSSIKTDGDVAAEWKRHVSRAKLDALRFSTWSGRSINPDGECRSDVCRVPH